MLIHSFWTDRSLKTVHSQSVDALKPWACPRNRICKPFSISIYVDDESQRICFAQQSPFILCWYTLKPMYWYKCITSLQMHVCVYIYVFGGQWGWESLLAHQQSSSRKQWNCMELHFLLIHCVSVVSPSFV